MKRLFYFIKPLWLRKILTNILGFVLIYPFLLYSAESAFLIALFFSVFAYKKKILQNSVIDQIIIASICGSLFSTWHIKDIDINPLGIYALESILACIFIRIYDVYKPSFIGRFYKYDKNTELGYMLGAILNGILSGFSVLLVIYAITTMYSKSLT